MVVGIALTVWFFALYYAGGLTIDLAKENHLRWSRLALIAGTLFFVALLLWQITVPWIGITLVLLLIIAIALWLSRHRGDKALREYLKAGALLGVTFGFWYLGLVMMLLVLTFWQTAALTLGLAAFGVCAWIVYRSMQRWPALAESNRRAGAVARAVGFLVLGVALFAALIATS